MARHCIECERPSRDCRCNRRDEADHALIEQLHQQRQQEQAQRQQEPVRSYYVATLEEVGSA